METAGLYAALSDRNRRRILSQLEEKERTVGDLVQALRLRQPLVSHHLGILRGLGIVEARKEGRHRIYRIASASVAKKLKALDTAAESLLEAAEPAAPARGTR
jgi:DNA-binding transcriptional ArsR family regulator